MGGRLCEGCGVCQLSRVTRSTIARCPLLPCAPAGISWQAIRLLSTQKKFFGSCLHGSRGVKTPINCFVCSFHS